MAEDTLDSKLVLVTLNPERSFILPGKDHGSFSYPDLDVSFGRGYYKSNWSDSHLSLYPDFFILTPRQFFDILEMLKSGKMFNSAGKKLDSALVERIYNEITEQREPWRGEWFDAQFKKVNGMLYMCSNHKLINEQLAPQIQEQLEACIVEDCYVDLDSFNKQGMPTRKSAKQEYVQRENVYFWYPRESCVAGFRAVSGRVLLDCWADPAASDPGLGVRRAKVRT